MILWRPVGLAEMGLVFDSGMRRFPPRLPEQPIFYPVLAESYAAEIARGWNVRDAPHAGYVLRFELDDEYGARFDVQVVGASVHRELWIPADQLGETNAHILGTIHVLEGFFGAGFRGEVPDEGVLRGQDARQQIRLLSGMPPEQVAAAIEKHPRTVFLHYPFWKAAGHDRFGLDAEAVERCLAAVRSAWEQLMMPAPLLEHAGIVADGSA